MTEQQTYAPGTPIWVDLAAPDAGAARAFYTALFGWDVFVNPDPQFGGYGMFTQGGQEVAGVGPTMNEGQPAAWSTYVLTEDADATAAAVAEAGGKMLFGPHDVGDQGRVLGFQDPTGAYLGAWQNGERRMTPLFNTPVSVAWNELHTRDVETASRFYEAVFGWEADHTPAGGAPYTQWQVDGRTVAGGTTVGLSEGHPPYWLVYFAVHECDATVARARELGAAVVTPATSFEYGRFAVLRDPQGAVVAVASS